MNKPKLSTSGVPVILMNEVISWEDWLKGRRARRETGNKVAPEIIRRPSSSSDRRLRKLFNGERGLPLRAHGGFVSPPAWTTSEATPT
jgi:hypothetical protein